MGLPSAPGAHILVSPIPTTGAQIPTRPLERTLLAYPVLTALTFRKLYFAFLATGFEVGCLHFRDNNYYQLFVYCCILFLTQDPITFMKTTVSESTSKLYQRNLKMVSQVIIIII